MLNFKVEGMTCGHCVGAVTNAIKEKYPQATVTIDLSAKTVVVDGIDDFSNIAQLIQEEGYNVVG